ncbi:MAG: hypothetical protein GYB66_05215 [Chloroflexi bacterium]|nr:hypothetical protein [Chloroflexota bacterium]
MWPWFLRSLSLIGITMILLGCGSDNSPIIVSPAATSTPETPTPPTPTIVVLEPTTTRVPTATQPAADLARGATPTSPLRPTFTPAPPTLTATVEPTLIGLDIAYFASNNDIIAPGDNVTLFWRVIGADRVTIYRLSAEAERENPRPVDAEGQITVSTDPDATEAAEFVLVAERGEIEIEEILVIEVNCDEAWFFAPSPGGCPNEPPTQSNYAQQAFENGYMIWVEALDSIFVIYENGTELGWQRFEDTFEEGGSQIPAERSPPPNRYRPVRGFGKVWQEFQSVQDRLGWAIAPEAGYSGQYQISGLAPEDETVFLERLNGDVVQLLPEGNSWQIIFPEAEPGTTDAEATNEP